MQFTIDEMHDAINSQVRFTLCMLFTEDHLVVSCHVESMCRNVKTKLNCIMCTFTIRGKKKMLKALYEANKDK